MAQNLKFLHYPGFGQKAADQNNMSQVVRVGNIIHISGQGGIDRETGVTERDLRKQIALAFENVDVALKLAHPGAGWHSVYKIRSYQVPMTDEALELMTENLKRVCPNHKPLWTVVGVPRLAFDDMRVEIEVEALVE